MSGLGAASDDDERIMADIEHELEAGTDAGTDVLAAAERAVTALPLGAPAWEATDSPGGTRAAELERSMTDRLVEGEHCGSVAGRAPELRPPEPTLEPDFEVRYEPRITKTGGTWAKLTPSEREIARRLAWSVVSWDTATEVRFSRPLRFVGEGGSSDLASRTVWVGNLDANCTTQEAVTRQLRCFGEVESSTVVARSDRQQKWALVTFKRAASVLRMLWGFAAEGAGDTQWVDRLWAAANHYLCEEIIAEGSNAARTGARTDRCCCCTRGLSNGTAVRQRQSRKTDEIAASMEHLPAPPQIGQLNPRLGVRHSAHRVSALELMCAVQNTEDDSEAELLEQKLREQHKIVYYRARLPRIKAEQHTNDNMIRMMVAEIHYRKQHSLAWNSIQQLMDAIGLELQRRGLPKRPNDLVTEVKEKFVSHRHLATSITRGLDGTPLSSPDNSGGKFGLIRQALAQQNYGSSLQDNSAGTYTGSDQDVDESTNDPGEWASFRDNEDTDSHEHRLRNFLMRFYVQHGGSNLAGVHLGDDGEWIYDDMTKPRTYVLFVPAMQISLVCALTGAVVTMPDSRTLLLIWVAAAVLLWILLLARQCGLASMAATQPALVWPENRRRLAHFTCLIGLWLYLLGMFLVPASLMTNTYNQGVAFGPRVGGYIFLFMMWCGGWVYIWHGYDRFPVVGDNDARLLMFRPPHSPTHNVKLLTALYEGIVLSGFSFFPAIPWGAVDRPNGLPDPTLLATVGDLWWLPQDFGLVAFGAGAIAAIFSFVLLAAVTQTKNLGYRLFVTEVCFDLLSFSIIKQLSDVFSCTRGDVWHMESEDSLTASRVCDTPGGFSCVDTSPSTACWSSSHVRAAAATMFLLLPYYAVSIQLRITSQAKSSAVQVDGEFYAVVSQVKILLAIIAAGWGDCHPGVVILSVEAAVLFLLVMTTVQGRRGLHMLFGRSCVNPCRPLFRGLCSCMTARTSPLFEIQDDLTRRFSNVILLDCIRVYGLSAAAVNGIIGALVLLRHPIEVCGTEEEMAGGWARSGSYTDIFVLLSANFAVLVANAAHTRHEYKKYKQATGLEDGDGHSELEDQVDYAIVTRRLQYTNASSGAARKGQPFVLHVSEDNTGRTDGQQIEMVTLDLVFRNHSTRPRCVDLRNVDLRRYGGHRLYGVLERRSEGYHNSCIGRKTVTQELLIHFAGQPGCLRNAKDTVETLCRIPGVKLLNIGGCYDYLLHDLVSAIVTKDLQTEGPGMRLVIDTSMGSTIYIPNFEEMRVFGRDVSFRLGTYSAVSGEHIKKDDATNIEEGHRKIQKGYLLIENRSAKAPARPVTVGMPLKPYHAAVLAACLAVDVQIRRRNSRAEAAAKIEDTEIGTRRSITQRARRLSVTAADIFKHGLGSRLSFKAREATETGIHKIHSNLQSLHITGASEFIVSTGQCNIAGSDHSISTPTPLAEWKYLCETLWSCAGGLSTLVLSDVGMTSDSLETLFPTSELKMLMGGPKAKRQGLELKASNLKFLDLSHNTLFMTEASVNSSNKTVDAFIPAAKTAKIAARKFRRKAQKFSTTGWHQMCSGLRLLGASGGLVSLDISYTVPRVKAWEAVDALCDSFELSFANKDRKRRQRNRYEQLWKAVDIDGSGALSKDELRQVVDSIYGNEKQLTDEELDSLWKQIDRDGSGQVEFGEFIYWWELEKDRHTGTDQNHKMEDQIVVLNSLWRSLDADKNGVLDKQEVKSGFAGRLSDSDFDEVWESMDADNNDGIQKGKFEAWWALQSEELRDKLLATNQVDSALMLKYVWASIDTDADGTLHKFEVSNVMVDEMGMKPEAFEEAWKSMDADGGGNIDYQEFLAWWNKQGEDMKKELLTALGIETALDDKLVTLQILRMAGCNLNDAAVARMGVMLSSDHHSLTELDISDCPDISAAGKAEFAASLRNSDLQKLTIDLGKGSILLHVEPNLDLQLHNQALEPADADILAAWLVKVFEYDVQVEPQSERTLSLDLSGNPNIAQRGVEPSTVRSSGTALETASGRCAWERLCCAVHDVGTRCTSAEAHKTQKKVLSRDTSRYSCRSIKCLNVAACNIFDEAACELAKCIPVVAQVDFSDNYIETGWDALAKAVRQDGSRVLRITCTLGQGELVCTRKLHSDTTVLDVSMLKLTPGQAGFVSAWLGGARATPFLSVDLSNNDLAGTETCPQWFGRHEVWSRVTTLKLCNCNLAAHLLASDAFTRVFPPCLVHLDLSNNELLGQAPKTAHADEPQGHLQAFCEQLQSQCTQLVEFRARRCGIAHTIVEELCVLKYCHALRLIDLSDNLLVPKSLFDPQQNFDNEDGSDSAESFNRFLEALIEGASALQELRLSGVGLKLTAKCAKTIDMLIRKMSTNLSNSSLTDQGPNRDAVVLDLSRNHLIVSKNIMTDSARDSATYLLRKAIIDLSNVRTLLGIQGAPPLPRGYRHAKLRPAKNDEVICNLDSTRPANASDTVELPVGVDMDEITAKLLATEILLAEERGTCLRTVRIYDFLGASHIGSGGALALAEAAQEKVSIKSICGITDDIKCIDWVNRTRAEAPYDRYLLSGDQSMERISSISLGMRKRKPLKTKPYRLPPMPREIDDSCNTSGCAILDLSTAGLWNDDIRVICTAMSRMRHWKLRDLILSGNNIGADGKASIATSIQQCAHLEYLAYDSGNQSYKSKKVELRLAAKQHGGEDDHRVLNLAGQQLWVEDALIAIAWCLMCRIRSEKHPEGDVIAFAELDLSDNPDLTLPWRPKDKDQQIGSPTSLPPTFSGSKAEASRPKPLSSISDYDSWFEFCTQLARAAAKHMTAFGGGVEEQSAVVTGPCSLTGVNLSHTGMHAEAAIILGSRLMAVHQDILLAVLGNPIDQCRLEQHSAPLLWSAINDSDTGIDNRNTYALKRLLLNYSTASASAHASLASVQQILDEAQLHAAASTTSLSAVLKQHSLNADNVSTDGSSSSSAEGILPCLGALSLASLAWDKKKCCARSIPKSHGTLLRSHSYSEISVEEGVCMLNNERPSVDIAPSSVVDLYLLAAELRLNIGRTSHQTDIHVHITQSLEEETLSTIELFWTSLLLHPSVKTVCVSAPQVPTVEKDIGPVWLVGLANSCRSLSNEELRGGSCSHIDRMQSLYLPGLKDLVATDSSDESVRKGWENLMVVLDWLLVVPSASTIIRSHSAPGNTDDGPPPPQSRNGLRNLVLSSCGLDSAAVADILTKLNRGSCSLTSLDLSGNARISNEMIDQCLRTLAKPRNGDGDDGRTGRVSRCSSSPVSRSNIAPQSAETSGGLRQLTVTLTSTGGGRTEVATIRQRQPNRNSTASRVGVDTVGMIGSWEMHLGSSEDVVPLDDGQLQCAHLCELIS